MSPNSRLLLTLLLNFHYSIQKVYILLILDNYLLLTILKDL
nr:MAG TPA: hypothetical protein [Bacteriophage sp.]